ncbi:hypothetical protein RAS1_40840 [Phycisphaerae bacterium RAS1]|nr:hypothetical protein RAS1_40840 [Phycisphaerae bacterium RAS1]
MTRWVTGSVAVLMGGMLSLSLTGGWSRAGEERTPAENAPQVDSTWDGGEGFDGDEYAGPDVTLQEVAAGGIQNYGAIGGIRGYMFESYTCNIGTANLRWGGSWQGSPSLAQNAFRLHNGRLMQIGQSWVKQACCAGATSGCGTCNGVGGSMLGAGCRDYYSAGWNGGQSRLGARSGINAYTGAHVLASTTTGDAIYKRLQVPQVDLDAASFPGALYFLEGAYIASDDAVGAAGSGNPQNNASHKRFTVTAGTYAWTAQGSMVNTPAIQAWRDHGLGVGIPDSSVTIGILDVPSEGRFWTATKVRDNNDGTWTYDYAIYNMSSDRSGGSFSVPLAAGVTVNPLSVGFKDVNYHSGEIYDNTDWTKTVAPAAVNWNSPQTFAQNPNSNALRWGTMYNFWFVANSPPTSGTVTLGLFKPHTPQAVSFTAPVPQANVFPGDANCDGVVDILDINPFELAISDPLAYAAAYPGCNILNCDTNHDGSVDVLDINAFILLIQG